MTQVPISPKRNVEIYMEIVCLGALGLDEFAALAPFIGSHVWHVLQIALSLDAVSNWCRKRGVRNISKKYN